MSFKETLFGAIPSDWTLATIGDIAELRQGLQISKELRISEKRDGYIPLLKITDLPKKVFSEYVTDIKEQYRADCSDIIYTRTGQVGLVYTDIEGCVHNNCFKVIVDYDNFDKYFIYYYLKSNNVFYYSNSVASGSVQKDLKHSAFKSCVIGYPDIVEQKAIGHILSTLDEKIEVNNQINKTLENMAQAIFKQWFVDFEFPNEDGEPYQSSGGEMAHSELGMIPKGWEVERIGNIVETNTESYSAKDNWTFVNYLDTGNITKNVIADISKLSLGSDKIPSRAKRKVINNDIIFSTVRPNQNHYGLIKEPIENLLVSTGFVVIRSRLKHVTNEFLYLWLTQNEVVDFLQGIGEMSTSTYPSIKPSHIENLKIALPTEDILCKINNVFNGIYNCIYQFNKQNKNLSEIRDNLLPKLMSGEIRVPLDTQGEVS